jgi:hypothetical protein
MELYIIKMNPRFIEISFEGVRTKRRVIRTKARFVKSLVGMGVLLC